jgi:hypothetical protein
VQGNGLAAAEAERRKSEERLESVRRHVVQPLTDKARHNQFAQLIRDSLTTPGHREGGTGT